MYIDFEKIVMWSKVAGVMVSAITILLAVYRWYLKQNRQDIEIKSMKSELCLLTYGLLACLKGLQEKGCNGPVTQAIDKIEKHINKQAHDQEE